MQPEALKPDRGPRGTKRSPDRPPYKRVSIAEAVEILELHKRGVSQSEIARVTGLSVQRVNARVQAFRSTTDTALSVLQAAAHQAATDWVRSFRPASKKGEHRPMRDALIAVGVVAPDAQNVGITVVVGSGELPLSTLDVEPFPGAKVPQIEAHNVDPD